MNGEILHVVDYVVRCDYLFVTYKEEKALFLKERDLGEMVYKPKWKVYLRDKRLKIHRIRSTI